MSEFVDIKTSVADILGIANGLRAKGEALTETMTTATAQITALENHRETLPYDDFTKDFLANYHGDAQGADGTKLPVNEAVKRSAMQMGQALTKMGDEVAKAMWTYSGTDDDNAAGIKNAQSG